LGAVGMEFFPLLMDAEFFYLTLGFLAGIGMIFGLSFIDDFFSRTDDQSDELVHLHRCHSGRFDISIESVPSVYGTMSLNPATEVKDQFDSDETESIFSHDITSSETGDLDSASIFSGAREMSNLLLSSSSDWNVDFDALESLGKNEAAITQVLTNFRCIYDLLRAMEHKSASLTSMAVHNEVHNESLATNNKRSQQLSIDMAENIADSLDSDIHRLQYLVDHCRRLLEGSASSFVFGEDLPTLISSRRSKELQSNISSLVKTATDILHTFAATPLLQNIVPRDSDSSRKSAHQDRVNTSESSQSDKVFSLHKVYSQLKSMHKRLDTMHSTVDRAAFRYKRRKANLGPLPDVGSRIPLTLVLPVMIDCCCDGFMIGLIGQVSARAGLVLGLVTFIEMGALGAVYGLRVLRCSGNSREVRLFAISLPPFMILLACMAGMNAGSNARASKALLSAWLGFGAVALIQLSIVELLADAFSAGLGIQIYATMFLGIWGNLGLDRLQDNF